MRYLLDKMTARFTVQGLLKIAEQRTPTPEEFISLDLFARATPSRHNLFIAPPTANVLNHLMHYPHYATIIQLFLNRVEIAQPTRYFKRWARRLRDYGFTREDAAMLALATFSTNADGSMLGMHALATFDQPMMNQWAKQITNVEDRLQQMRNDLHEPYTSAVLPEVLRPDQLS